MPLCPLYCTLVQASVLSSAFCPLCGPMFAFGLCPLYDLLLSLQPFVLSTAPCPICCPLSSLRPSVSSAVICTLYILYTLYCPMSPSTILCTLYGLLFPLRSYGPSIRRSMTFTPIRPFLYSVAICLSFSPFSSLQPSISSSALIPLYDPMSYL